MFLLLCIALYAVLAVVGARIALRKGRSPWLGAFLGCVSLGIGIVVLLLLPSRPAARRA